MGALGDTHSIGIRIAICDFNDSSLAMLHHKNKKIQQLVSPNRHESVGEF